ncbi:MAG: bifunctional phosphoribosylaminoimidazolecarboxamide formyltransferase/IMP cyclohydrolase [Candidatus Melainabacteria bacterium]|nr:bifunctional phosphoribosylaminoimidazolecarboxamide formyltransferase/IMP cyclohydrolase [Candidatus Melainabacteria bacterium]
MTKKALISVSDKTGLDQLLSSLKEQGYHIISTGGTAKFIREAGFEVQEVAELTAFPEMLGGRVKTLHPKVLAGILARRDEEQDLKDLAAHEIEEIDLVVVNLYPFADVISRENLVYADAIENIDIGGPTLLRSAAKNYQSITVLSDPNQYAKYIEVSKTNDEQALLDLRQELAVAVFEHTTNYDKLIAQFLKSRAESMSSLSLEDEEASLPQEYSLNLELKSKLRYGENPHQEAALYTEAGKVPSGLAAAKQLHGKEISYNNYLDLQAAWNIASEYDDTIPCVAIIKHNNPCGVAIAPSIAQAYQDALSCDTVSAFGGIVAANKEVDLAAANEMIEIFLEAIIAPSFSAEALEVLKTKKNLRLLEIKPAAKNKELNIKRIDGGYLIQENNDFLHDAEQLETVTKAQVEETQWVDLMLAWKVVKHVKSNAIVAVKDGKTIGVGCGQSNRVKSVADALSNQDMESRGAVLASDAFFPFADNIDICAQNHISAIIQPGGSIRDKEVIEACDEAGIAMVFTKTRHFLH